MTKSGRQQVRGNPVGRATRKALERVDFFLQGGTLNLPAAEYRAACDELLRSRSASVCTGIFFFMFYWLEEPTWDLNSIPTGWRSDSYGDKVLCEGLTNRHVTLHGRIKGYGDNVGSKGDQANFRPMTDERYGPFLRAVRGANPAQRRRIADYLAERFAESRRLPSPLPAVGHDVLTFVRAKDLFHRLVGTPSGGAIQQFLIAALLFVYRRRSGISVVTHQVHAADTSDRVAGDIEECRGTELQRAYEVTLRPEWKSRVSGFRQKMDKFRLSKYVIIAAGVNSDEELAVPAKLALKIEPHERDIAVIDIVDVLNFLAAELSPDELREAVNKCYEYLNDLNLCGRPKYIASFWEVVHRWLTATGGAT